MLCNLACCLSCMNFIQENHQIFNQFGFRSGPAFMGLILSKLGCRRQSWHRRAIYVDVHLRHSKRGWTLETELQDYSNQSANRHDLIACILFRLPVAHLFILYGSQSHWTCAVWPYPIELELFLAAHMLTLSVHGNPNWLSFMNDTRVEAMSQRNLKCVIFENHNSIITIKRNFSREVFEINRLIQNLKKMLR